MCPFSLAFARGPRVRQNGVQDLLPGMEGDGISALTLARWDAHGQGRTTKRRGSVGSQASACATPS